MGGVRQSLRLGCKVGAWGTRALPVALVLALLGLASGAPFSAQQLFAQQLPGQPEIARPPFSQDSLTIATWNIEHLSSDGRGFGGGYGAGSLPRRTAEQLEQIGRFLRDGISAEIIAVQEAGVGYVERGRSRSRELDSITAAMGQSWEYALPAVDAENWDAQQLVLAYIWDSSRVRAIRIAEMQLPQLQLAGKELFDRMPLLGYFEALPRAGQSPRNDFLLVNIHLASGQGNEENHLIALTLLEYSLGSELRRLGISESDRIILGDFNDNPAATTAAGAPRYSRAAYEHLAFKGYTRLAHPQIAYSRMDSNLGSLIDHILVNRSALRHLDGGLWQFRPAGGPGSYAAWRHVFSDHFPLWIEIVVSADDDAD